MCTYVCLFLCPGTLDVTGLIIMVIKQLSQSVIIIANTGLYNSFNFSKYANYYAMNLHNTFLYVSIK